jgi:hypothetical protein
VYLIQMQQASCWPFISHLLVIYLYPFGPNNIITLYCMLDSFRSRCILLF